MESLQKQVDGMRDEFVPKSEFDRAAKRIEELLLEHTKQSNISLQNITTRIDDLYKLQTK